MLPPYLPGIKAKTTRQMQGQRYGEGQLKNYYLSLLFPHLLTVHLYLINGNKADEQP